MTYKEALYFLTHNGASLEQETVSFQMMVEALEKQIPKKPNKAVDRSWGTMKEVNVCPCCDYYIGNYAFINVKDITEKHNVTYCETCGQAIDWSEVE